jgi:hypothetical protein
MSYGPTALCSAATVVPEETAGQCIVGAPAMPVLLDAGAARRHLDDGVRELPPLSELRLHLDSQHHPSGAYHDCLHLAPRYAKELSSRSRRRRENAIPHKATGRVGRPDGELRRCRRRRSGYVSSMGG